MLFRRPELSPAARRARDLRVVFGLDRPEPRHEADMIASQASDMREFIQLLDSRDRRERAAEAVERAFTVEERFDLGAVLDALPATRF